MRTPFKAVTLLMLIVFSLFAGVCAKFLVTWNAPVSVNVVSPTPVHNLDTGSSYTAIQEAIDAPETLNGHTILVDPGVYNEVVIINKSISLIGGNRDSTIIDGNGTASRIVTITSSNVNFTDFTVINGGEGHGDYGIYIDAANHCIITSNNVINCESGLCLVSCSEILVSYNNLRSHDLDGLVIASSFNNTLQNNTISDSHNGIYTVHCFENFLIDNNVTNSGYNGISLRNSSANELIGNTIKNQTQGIYLGPSLGGEGQSSENIVMNNVIAEHTYGVFLFESSNNHFSHNNFIHNTIPASLYNSINIWDDGYPSGGNFWSNYNDVDDYSGPFQNETGSDGIWDHPYVINVNNTDHFPLTYPHFYDDEAPVIKNVRHLPLYPNSTNLIHFYADVTDNLGVVTVKLNYTLDHSSWSLKEMQSLGNETYSTSLGPYPQGQILGFYVVAYDFAGNKGIGSEIVPPLPDPPPAAPVLISDTPPNPLPDGRDISYNVTDGGLDIFVNVTEIDIYIPGGIYYFNYSLDGGITWLVGVMTDIGDFIWRFLVDATTNIIFKIVSEDGMVESEFYWIIVGPWKYPIFLYFSTNESYYPVKGLDFDFAQTGDYLVEDNKASYDTYFSDYQPEDLDDDGIPDAPAYTYMNPRAINDGCLVIEYWIYYAFNLFPIFDDVLRDDHEHDFEPIFLWIDLATGNIKKMACGQHHWVNHYLFDVLDPPSRINLAVEEGGHGTALLADYNEDGLPDLLLGHYLRAHTAYGDVPVFWSDWLIERYNPASFVAQLHPWVIYDPRIPSSALHLFDDTSILTTGLDYNVIVPQLSLDVNELANHFQFLTNLLGKSYLLKTNFAAKFLLDSGMTLQFFVSAPLYRQEFRDPVKLWNKLSCAMWFLKWVVKLALVPVMAKALITYFGVAGALGFILPKVLGFVTNTVISVLFDPIQGVVLDLEGNALGPNTINDLPRGLVLATRNMTDNLYDLFLIMTNSSNDYVYELEGVETADPYNFTVSCTDGQGYDSSFNAIQIPITLGGVHRFWINWTVLDADGLGVEVWVDQDGDGTFEHQFLSDAELTGAEFEQLIAHDVAVREVLTSKSGCLPKETLGEGRTLGFNMTLENQGGYQETFNVTLFANATLVNSTEMTLLNGESKNITVFWNTTGWPKGTYQLQVDADIVSQETDSMDNVKFYGEVMVTISGDVDGDRDVDIFDIVRMAVNYSCTVLDPCYDPNSDIDGDGDIDIFDIVTACTHYDENW